MLSAGLTVTATGVYTNTAVEVETVTGNVLDDDSLGAGGTAELRIDSGAGFVPVTDGLQVTGQHGTLTINQDGSYSYQPNADASVVGQADVFTYQLVHPTQGTVAATLTINIEAGGSTMVASSASAPANTETDINVWLATEASLDGTVFADQGSADSDNPPAPQAEDDPTALVGVVQAPENGAWDIG
nr:cadherin-like domain-containing protein [Chelatococcus sp. YT9]